MIRANKRDPPWMHTAPSDMTSQDSDSDLTPLGHVFHEASSHRSFLGPVERGRKEEWEQRWVSMEG